MDEDTEDLIAVLKGLLAAANRGELTGLTYVGIAPDQGATYGMAGCVLSDPFHSLGALTYAQAELVNLVTEAVQVESSGAFRA